jgi:hypothetical protein
VDHALRAIQQKFTQLSIAADHKASIVIGSTLVMLGFLVDTVHGGRAPVAVYVMGGFALLSCLFALLGVLPRVTRRGRSQCGPALLTNPLFFDDFDTISIEDYFGDLADVVADDANLYRGHCSGRLPAGTRASDASTITCATAT